MFTKETAWCNNLHPEIQPESSMFSGINDHGLQDVND